MGNLKRLRHHLAVLSVDPATFSTVYQRRIWAEAKVLGLPWEGERLHAASFELTKTVLQKTAESKAFPSRTLLMTNTLWGQKGFEFRKEFMDLAGQCFRAETKEVDFQ